MDKPCRDGSIDDENRCRKGLKCTEIKGFQGSPQKPAATRNPFHTFSLSNLHTEKAELRDSGLNNCVARLQVRCSVAAFYYLRVNVLSLAFRLILSYNRTEIGLKQY